MNYLKELEYFFLEYHGAKEVSLYASYKMYTSIFATGICGCRISFYSDNIIIQIVFNEKILHIFSFRCHMTEVNVSSLTNMNQMLLRFWRRKATPSSSRSITCRMSVFPPDVKQSTSSSSLMF